MIPLRASAIHVIALACAMAAAAALAACGGDGGGEDVELPTASLRPTEPVPFASPTVEAQTLTSTEKAYRVTFPDDWTLRPNYVNVGVESIDAAFLNRDVPSGDVRPTLSIGCIPKQAGGPPEQEEFQQGRLAALTQTLVAPPATSTRQVDGIQAAVATYVKEIVVDPERTDRIRQQDVFLVGPLCAFTISLLSSPEDEAVFQPQFDEMLASFELLP